MKEIQRGYKVKLYPNKEQEQQLLKIAGACRFIYNYFLDRKKTEYLQNGKNLTYNMLSRELTQLRKEIKWLSDVQAVPLQQSLRNLDVAYNKFFSGQNKFPKFHTKKSKQSIRKVNGWSIKDNKIVLQRGVSIRFRGNFPLEAQGTLTITRDSVGDWYAATIGYEEVKQPKLKGAIGIDLGLTHIAITSNGKKFDNPRVLKGLLRQLQVASKALSRTKKGSKTRQKKRIVLAKLHRKVERVRKNGLHHISKAIVSKNHAIIAVEDLAVKNMMKNRKLSRAIGDVSWNELLRQITYKQEWNGGQVVKIGRFFPSSKTCFSCNFIIDKLPLNIREWECPKCNSILDRDINAAQMILKQAEEQLEVEGKTEKKRKLTMTTPAKL